MVINKSGKYKTIDGCIRDYFETHADQDIEHGRVVDFVNEHFDKARDPWRNIRQLYQKGFLIKVRKGVYRRPKGYKGEKKLSPFPPKIREQIFERDNYRCVVCGHGLHDGYEIHADHIRPQNKGGKSTLENGQTLCSEHNLMKKRYGTTDFLGKYCKKMLKRAKDFNDPKVESLFKELLEVLKKYGYKK